MHCIKCGSEKRIKNGYVMKKQRYKCKVCGYNYTNMKELGYKWEVKLLALKMYKEGLGFRSIGRILEVSNVSVLRWIKKFGESVKEMVESTLPKEVKEVGFVEMDEMWHFIGKKGSRYGYGLLFAAREKEVKCWDLFLVRGMTTQPTNFMTR